jgi:hypothetical protein
MTTQSIVSKGAEMTMKAYEFSTKVTPDGKLPIPDAYAKNIPTEHLMNPSGEPDPSFDVAAWNKAWDKVEAEMEDATNV